VQRRRAAGAATEVTGVGPNLKGLRAAT